MPPMSLTPSSRIPETRWKKAAVAAAVFFLLVVAGIYSSYRILLATPFATSQVSKLLSHALGTTVTVTGIQEAAGAVSLTGIIVANPAGYSDRPFAVVRSLSLRPRWLSLASAARDIDIIQVEGLAVNLEKNTTGWNYARLITPRKKKGPAAETAIKSLTIADSSIRMNGITIGGINAELDNISTTGRTITRIAGKFHDPLGNIFTVKGRGKGGSDTSAHVEIDAPSLALKPLPDVLGKKISPIITGAKGSFFLTADFAEKKLNMSPRASLRSAVNGSPVSGTVAGDLVYSLADDTLILHKGIVEVNKVRASASGTVSSVKGDADYKLIANIAPADLSGANTYLHNRVGIGGTAHFAPLRIAGTKTKGITAISGAADFSDILFSDSKGNRLALLSGDVAIKSLEDQISITGHLGAIRQFRAQLIHDLTGTFSASLSRRFILAGAQADVVGKVAGGDATLHAEVGERGGKPTGRVVLKKASLSKVAEVFAPKSKVQSGTLEAEADFHGPSAKELDGRATVAVSKASIGVENKSHTVNKMVIQSSYRVRDRVVAAEGIVDASGTTSGKAWHSGFRAQVNGKRVDFREGKAAFGDMSAAIPEVALTVGGDTPKSRTFDVLIRNASLTSPLAALTGLSAQAHIVGTEPATMDVDGVVTAAQSIVKGADLGAQTVKISAKGGMGTVVLSGAGGKINASAGTDMRDPANRTNFSGNVNAFPVAGLSPLLMKEGRRPNIAGAVTSTFSGSFSRKSGVNAAVTILGSDLSASDPNNRQLFEHLSLRGDIDIVGKTLALKNGEVSVGDKIAASVTGKLDNFTVASRTGSFAFAVAPSPLTALFDEFANILPPALQEASATGVIGVRGNAVFTDGKPAVDGEVSAGDINLELPGQKVQVTGINGGIPFSLNFQREQHQKPDQGPSFSRATYQNALRYLREKTGAGSHSLTVKKVIFGASELGPLTLTMRAEKGNTRIEQLNADIYGGRILGTGNLLFAGKPDFTFNLAIDDLSLRTLCDNYPNIKNYLSGRVDGVLSIAGDSFKSTEMKGFLHLWTRENKKEKMLVSKEFLQKIAGKKLKGIFFRNDRPYDNGEISAYLEKGFLSFTTLDLSHTNIFGVRDLSVAVAPVQNKIALSHLLESIKTAAARGKSIKGGDGESAAPVTDFKWEE